MTDIQDINKEPSIIEKLIPIVNEYQNAIIKIHLLKRGIPKVDKEKIKKLQVKSRISKRKIEKFISKNTS